MPSFGSFGAVSVSLGLFENKTVLVSRSKYGQKLILLRKKMRTMIINVIFDVFR